jgi:ribosomal protein S18 acetylase RimI-like enzyme
MNTEQRDELFTFFKKSDKFKYITKDYLKSLKTYYVIRDDGTLLGVVTFKNYQDCKRSWSKKFPFKNTLCVSELLVGKEYRHKGYGTKLLNKVKQYAQYNGYDKLVLSVTDDNKNAKGLYEKYGFDNAGSFDYKYIKLVLDIYTMDLVYEVPEDKEKFERPVTRAFKKRRLQL